MAADEVLIRVGLGAGDGHRRGVRLRPLRGVRDREQRVLHVSRLPRARGELVVVKLGGTTLAEQRSVLDEVAARSRTDRPRAGPRRRQAAHRVAGTDGRGEPVRGRPAGHGRRRAGGGARRAAGRHQRGARRRAAVARARTPSGSRAWTAGCWSSERIAVAGAGGHGDRRPGRRCWRCSSRPGSLPVIAPLALDADGVICNVNADDAAAGPGRGAGRAADPAHRHRRRPGRGRPAHRRSSRTVRRRRSSRTASSRAAWCPRCAARCGRWRWGAPETVDRGRRRRRRPQPRPG